MDTNIGFIGLGIMGKPMARNLLAKGERLIVYNRSASAVSEIAADAGAQPATSPADVARQCRIIILMLPDGPDVEQVIAGDRGILGAVQPGSIVVDMSSIDPDVSRRMSAALREKDAAYVDAPVSGGEPGAVAGTLAIMCGGGERDVERVRPLLSKMGKSVVRIGDVGAGQATKLVNQVLVALHLQAMAEAFYLASRLGVEGDAVFAAIRDGLAGSNVLNAKVPKILKGDFAPGFKARLHLKDLRNALKASADAGAVLPATMAVCEQFKNLVAAGCGELDHCALMQVVALQQADSLA